MEVLLKSPEKKIRPFVRSKQKLLTQRSELESLPNVTIFEGTLRNVETLAECFAGATAAFLAIGETDNIPGTSVAQEQASAAVKALELVRKNDPNARLPQLIVLSSAALEKKFMKDFPAAPYAVLKRAAGHIYHDLRLAEEYLRSHGWVKQVYIKPGGLVHDTPKGHILSTERQQTFLSFLDLAAGMVEVAEADDDTWNLKNVSVLPAAPGTRFPWFNPYFL